MGNNHSHVIPIPGYHWTDILLSYDSKRHITNASFKNGVFEPDHIILGDPGTLVGWKGFSWAKVYYKKTFALESPFLPDQLSCPPRMKQDMPEEERVEMLSL